MGEDLIYKMVGFLESASPVLWEASVRQATMTGYSNLMWCIVLLICALASARGAVYGFREAKKERYTEWEWIWPSLATIAPFLTGFAFGCLDYAIRMLANPTYYAVKLLLKLIPGSS